LEKAQLLQVDQLALNSDKFKHALAANKAKYCKNIHSNKLDQMHNKILNL